MFEAYSPARLRRERPEAVRLALPFVVLAAVGLWSSVVSVGYRQLIPPDPGPTLSLLVGPLAFYFVAYTLPAVAYVYARDVDVPLSVPGRDDVPAVALAWAIPVVLVGAVAVVGNVAFGVPLSDVTGNWVSPDASTLFLARWVLVSAGVRALGLGLLFFAVIYPTLRDVAQPGHAVALTAFVALVYEALPFSFGFSPLDPALAALSALAFVVSVVVGLALGVVYRDVEDAGSARAAVESVREGPYVALAVAGCVGLVLVAAGMAEFPDVVVGSLWVAVVAAGAAVLERTRSLWPALVTVSVYEAALVLVVYVEAVLGLAHRITVEVGLAVPPVF